MYRRVEHIQADGMSVSWEASGSINLLARLPVQMVDFGQRIELYVGAFIAFHATFYQISKKYFHHRTHEADSCTMIVCRDTPKKHNSLVKAHASLVFFVLCSHLMSVVQFTTELMFIFLERLGWVFLSLLGRIFALPGHNDTFQKGASLTNKDK